MSQQKNDAGILANAPSSIRQLFFVVNDNSNLMKQPRECMEIITTNIRQAVTSYLASSVIQPLLLHGDALAVLKDFPDESIDMAMTSPPYWQKRHYAQGGIGLERDYPEYIAHLYAIVKEVYRVLKSTGSFWLNIGDSYKNKHLLGIPWRVAFDMMDHQGWVLRNIILSTRSGRNHERQWTDVVGILQVQGDQLDYPYLGRQVFFVVTNNSIRMNFRPFLN